MPSSGNAPASWLALLSSLAVLIASCTGDDRETTPPTFVPALYAAGLPWIQDSNGYWYLVDTGAPRTLLSPRVVEREPDIFDEVPVSSIASLSPWVVGAALDPHAIVVEPPAVLTNVIDADILGGIIGADLMAGRLITFDPGNGQLVLDGPIPSNVPARNQVDVAIRGGGRTCFGAEDRCVEFPASRLIVPVEIEGQMVSAMVDTGAQNVAISQNLFARLPFDEDRPYFEIRDESDVVARTARSSALRIAGQEAASIAVSIYEFNDDLAKLQIETGVNIEMVLGQSFLQRFSFTIDYVEPTLYLSPYATQEHVVEDFTGLSFGVREEADCYIVTMLIPGRDAWNQGLEFGDCIVSLGDQHQPGGELTLDEFWDGVDSLPVGASVPVRIKRGESIIPMDITIENMLPAWNDELAY